MAAALEAAIGPPAAGAVAGLALKRVERLAFAAGLLLFGWLLQRIGWTALVRNLSAVGWGFLLILSLHGLTVLLNTFSWHRVIPQEFAVRPRALAPMLIAGDAVNAVNPLGVVGGELTRARLLSRILPGPAALASVGLAAMAQFFSQALFVLSGAPVALTWIADGPLRQGLVIVCALLTVALVLLLLALRFPAILRSIGRLLGSIRWLRDRWDSLPERWRNLEVETLESLRQRPGAFAISVGATFLDWQVGVLETFLILRFLHQPVGWPQAYAIEVLSVLIEGALFFVPARIGAQEGGKVLIFLAMGLEPAKGLALGIIRRLRQLAWAGVGLAILGRAGRRRAQPG